MVSQQGQYKTYGFTQAENLYQPTSTNIHGTQFTGKVVSTIHTGMKDSSTDMQSAVI